MHQKLYGRSIPFTVSPGKEYKSSKVLTGEKCLIPHVSWKETADQQGWDRIRSEFCSLIEQQAYSWGLDPKLVASIIIIESRGDPTQVNPYSRATGLMQVMPSDAHIHREYFYDRPSSAELLDPTTNLYEGCKDLATKITAWGSTREGILHYGPYDVGYSYADEVLGIYNDL